MSWIQNIKEYPVAAFYYFSRIFLHKNRGLLRFSQVIRGIFILGPLRKPLIRYYRKFKENTPIQTDKSYQFPNLDIENVVNNLNEIGYSLGGNLSEDHITKILQYCKKHGRIKYWNPHKECEAIDKLCRNATIVEIARRYLGIEPILWLTELKWSFTHGAEKENLAQSLHQEPVQYDPFAFHYDTLDFKSLTVFVYLTNVDMDSGPHVIIEGTHKEKSWKELIAIILNNREAQKNYANRIRTIVGEKGTVFFEETSSYHKASMCKTKRLMLKIDYVLRRKTPPPRAIITARL